MKSCPKCGRYTLDFDEYFGRFRCYNADCCWMPTTAGERHLRLMQARKSPVDVMRLPLDELGLTIDVAYDSINDVLLFDLQKDELAFEFPDEDVRIVWRIGRQSGDVVGIVVLGPREFGVSEIELNIAANLGRVADSIRHHCSTLPNGRPTRLAVENVAVTLRTQGELDSTGAQLPKALQKAVHKFSDQYLTA